MTAADAPGGLRVVVVGATGALGKEVIGVLNESALSLGALVPVATERSIGTEFEFGGQTVSVEAELPSLRGVDLVVLCTPAAPALELVRAALRAEVACIDCSGALAASQDVPLVVADLSSPKDVTAPVVSTPSGAALGWALALSPLEKAAGLERIVGTTLQPATRAGRAGIAVLSAESIALLSQGEVPDSEVFPGPVAFDCIPAIGELESEAGGATEFEACLCAELCRLIRADLDVAVTSVQVPTFVGEGSVLAVQTREPLSLEDALAALEKAPGVELWASDDGPPSTRDTAGRDEVLVGRVRRDPTHERGLLFWLATDGLRLVASNVVKLAETRLRLN